MNNKSSSKGTGITVEREFGKEDFLTLYIDVVLNRIKKEKPDEKEEKAGNENEIDFAC